MTAAYSRGPLPGERSPRLLHAASQDQVVTHAYAVATYGKGAVETHLRSRRWQRPVSGLLVQHNGPLTQSQQMWVALLAAPAGSLLHGLSGAEYDGLRGFTPDHLAIVMPGSSRSRRHRQLNLPDA